MAAKDTSINNRRIFSHIAGRFSRSMIFPALTMALLGALCISLALRSDGVWENDDILHFLVARVAPNSAANMLSVWGRPGFTVPYIFVAGIGGYDAGFMASRMLNMAMYFAATWLAFLTARQLHLPGSQFVPLCALVMPCFNQLYTPNTECAAAFYLSLGTWLLVIQKRRWAMAVFAIVPITRHELVVFMVPLGIFSLWRRDWISALLLGWAEAVWDLACIWKKQPLAILRYFEKAPKNNLGEGGWRHYFDRWLEISGPPVTALCIAGIIIILLHEFKNFRKRNVRPKPSDPMRLRIWISGGVIGIVVLHTILYAKNSFASGGYGRFLMPAAPWMAICAAVALSFALLPLSQSNCQSRGSKLVWLLLLAVCAAAPMTSAWFNISLFFRLLLPIAALLMLVRRNYKIIPHICVCILLLSVGQYFLVSARPHRVIDGQLLNVPVAELRTFFSVPQNQTDPRH